MLQEELYNIHVREEEKSEKLMKLVEGLPWATLREGAVHSADYIRPQGHPHTISFIHQHIILFFLYCFVSVLSILTSIYSDLDNSG